jgi:DNA helicase-2/ATP-dependent DNA helicase PcrA
MLGPAANDIWARTFHSACVRILRRDADKLGFDRSFTIYDTADSLALVKRIIKEMNLDDKSFPPRTLLGYISKAKDAMQTGEEQLAQARASHDMRKERIAQVYITYEQRKKTADAMDFDDLLYYTVRLLEEHAEVGDYYRRYFRYILIDEYQDTNNMQYRLTAALARGHNNSCVVGDDDQSIYKFRGATIENILSFESQYKNARVIRLEQNYRSTGNILDAANAVIRNNEGRKGKELWTKSDRGDLLTLYVAQNENDEAQYVASKIREGFDQGNNWRENVVLYRMNAQSNMIERAFTRSGVPYRVVGGMKFFDRAEIKDVVSYMCVVSNPDDDMRLLRIINNPARGIGGKTLELLQETAVSQGKSLFETAKYAGDYPALGRASDRLRLFARMIQELREAAEQLPLDELYDLIIEKSGYVEALKTEKSDENIGRIENIGELKTNILGYMKETGDSGLSGFLDEVALYTDIDALDKDSDAVVMMTLHTAKGLEFDNVFIVGVEEGVFPGIRSIGEPEELEEERRLCYVGLTRAKRKLTLTCARQRMLFGKTTSNLPSRFIDEIPDEYIEKKGSAPNYSFSGGDYGTASGARADIYPGTSGGDKPIPQKKIVPAPKTRAGDSYGFAPGDRVEHRAFGPGTITKMTPMGGDFLLEAEFEAGVKKLMLRAAAPNMTKI